VINVLRSEWIKLRTIRMNLVLVIIAVAFPLIVSTLIAALNNNQEMSSRDLLNAVQGSSVVTAMLLGVIGAATITGEFGFGTIRTTFAATPKRMRVIIGKSIITVVMAMVVEGLVVLFSYNVAAVVLTSRGRHIDLADAPSGTPAIIGVVLFAAIVALLGFGLGLLIRNTPAAVAILILWPLVAESIVGAILGAAGVDQPFKWLPYNAGISMANPDSFEGGLGRVGSGLYFFAVTGAITVLGAILTNRRDA
jgi:ABC-2 type transport system permease protein